MIEVKNRSGQVIYRSERSSLWEALEEAVERDISLNGANLSGADLSGANLSGADLRWAKLRGADLIRADLSRAKLSGADLSEADLRGADLRGADLSDALLWGAVIDHDTDLSGCKVDDRTKTDQLIGFLMLSGITPEQLQVMKRIPRD